MLEDLDPEDVATDGGLEDSCWHLEEYGEHCCRELPSNLPHETVERCDVCGETRSSGTSSSRIESSTMR